MISLKINIIYVFYVAILDLFCGKVCMGLAMYIYTDTNICLCVHAYI